MKFLAFICAMVIVLTSTITPAQAQTTTGSLATEVPLILVEPATPSAQASASALVEEKIQEKRDRDITETTGKQKSKLAAFLDEHPLEALSWHNVLQHGIRRAIDTGLPANIVVLIILFPAITAIISASRHLIGLQGFGIYIPAVLSVAFVSTGISTGVLLFAVVLLATVLLRPITQRLKLQYLPRTALLISGVSLVILIMLIVATITGFNAIVGINIFPLLIMILLMENFMETQISSSKSQAVQLTLETLFIAVICSLLIGWEGLQQTVLLNPEITIITVALGNILVGKYQGLRLLEYLRFRTIIES
ncbi:hypothetical protein KA078_02465 [Candidatus Woesebacteria bacterium]|nr:hypothetical protein [Candidatus Woesebacteria bacterium]